jgi:hypothetical protein
MGSEFRKRIIGGHTLYQILFTVGDPILAGSELLLEFISFTKKKQLIR